MYISEARVQTASAAQYLQQLCKHFAHKVPASHTETTGLIEFSIGRCQLHVEGGVLVIRCETQSAEDDATIRDVVRDHLLRFAWREKPDVIWAG